MSLGVADVVTHGPFAGSPVPVPPGPGAPAEGPTRERGLATLCAAAAPEVVFDARLTGLLPREPGAGRRALEALPAGVFRPLERAAAPLVVRVRRGPTTVVQLVNAAGQPCVALLDLEGRGSAVVDAADGSHLPLAGAGPAAIPLPAWGLRTVILDGGVAVTAARVEYAAAVRSAVAGRVETLLRRRAALETPAELPVLDNPDFELGGGEATAPRDRPGVPGWELVEPRRGSLTVVPADGGRPGRAAAFASSNGLSTLRSNPFPPPATGRVSVSARLRLREGEPQPPLRIAIEGVRDDREYYRFAPVGGLAGGRPLGGEWSQFVLQVDDLPGDGLESLRVRFDLLGPGAVQIDDVHVFDLAFDERQRVQLTRIVSRFEERLAAGDLGGCLADLDGHWPRFLETFVTDAVVAAAPAHAGGTAGEPAPPPRAGGMLDRMRRWWQ